MTWRRVAAFACALPLHATICVHADVAALAQKLKSADAKERRDAVHDLAKDGSSAAWTLVIEALHDADASVADRAQLDLQALGDASGLKSLLGKDGLSSSDAQVRVRAAEALGRVQLEVDGALVAKRLADKDPEMRRTAAWTIERLARSKHLDSKAVTFAKQELEPMARKDSDPSVRAAALYARDALEPLTVSHLFEDLSIKAPGQFRAAAVDLMGRLEIDSVPRLMNSWSSEEACARQAFTMVYARDRSRTGAIGLIAVVKMEKHPRVAWTAAEHLQDLSGKNIGLDADAWTAWAGTLMPNWKADSASGAASSKHTYASGSAEILDMPLLSDRIALLIDFSGPLSRKQATDKTRLETIDAALPRALEGLGANAEFNLIAFGDAAVPFEKALVVNNAANVKRATSFLKDCKAAGKSNLWDALLLAFADPKVDSILVITDGEPTGGHHVNLELVRDLLKERNRARHIVIDALIVGGKPDLQDRWTDICTKNGGRMQAVEMK
jgi:HEAT repeat protein